MKEPLPEKAVAYRLFESSPDQGANNRLYNKSEAHIIVTKKQKKVDITAAGCNALTKQLGKLLQQQLAMAKNYNTKQ